MKKFRTDNTEGFSQIDLDLMNEAYEKKITELDENDVNYENECQHIAETILNSWA